MPNSMDADVYTNTHRCSYNRVTARIRKRIVMAGAVFCCAHMKRKSTMPHTNQHSECADACSSCSEICYSTAMNHCLQVGGKHVEPEHFKLMLNCAKVCETSACLQLSGSPFSHHLCKVCAEICEACAKSCESLGEMDECVTACRKCAESCRRMAA